MWNCLASFGLILLQAIPSPTPTPASEGGGFGSFLWLMLGIMIGIVIGFLISKAFGHSSGKAMEKQTSTLDINTPPRVTGRQTNQVKSCPVCHSTYTDEALIYCVSDGATLLSIKGSPINDAGATMLNRDLPPTEAYRSHKPN